MGTSLRRLAMLVAALAPSLGSGPPVAAPPVTATRAAEPAATPGPFPGARLGREDSSSEYWDVTAIFDQGHRIFARFSISNEGPGDRTGYALGQILFPDGRIVPFQNGRLEGDWRLSDDRLRLKVGSSVLDLRGPPHHFEVDKNKKGIKFYLDYESTGPARTWGSAPKGVHVDLLTLGAPVSGTIWVRGVVEEPVPVTGRITVTHAWMDEGEPSLVRRRIETHALVPDEAGTQLYVVHALRAAKGREASWAVARAGDQWREAEGFEVALPGRSPGSEKGYPLPANVEIAGDGLSGRVELGGRLVRHDPLDAAPAAFRWILAFRAKPSHVWLASRHALSWSGGETPLRVEGAGVTSIYFMNPLD